MLQEARNQSDSRARVSRRYILLRCSIVACILLVSIAVGLPIYSQIHSIDIIESAGGFVNIEYEHPDWAPKAWGFICRRAFGTVYGVSLAAEEVRKDDLYACFKFKRLRQLHLDSDQVDDRHMECLSDLQCLEELKVFSSSVTPKGLSVIGKLDRLVELELGRASASDEIFRVLESNSNLKWLHIDCANSSITDEGVLKMAGGYRLQLLGILNSQISDLGLERICRNTSLEFLWVESDAVTDSSLSYLCRLRSLQSLGIVSSSVTDGGIGHLTCLPPSLRRLDIESSQVSKTAIQLLEESLPNCGVNLR